MAFRYGGLYAAMTFTIAVAVVGALRPGYSHATQLMSELGETGGPYSTLFNYGGFLPTGLLIVGFAWYLKDWLKSHGLDVSGAILIAIHGIGMIAATWVSCDTSCNPAEPSPSQIGHNAIAGIKFPLLIAATFVLSRQFAKVPTHAWLSRLSAVSGLVAIALLGAVIATAEVRHGTGIFQRAFLGVLYAWLALVNACVAKRPAVTMHDPASP